VTVNATSGQLSGTVAEVDPTPTTTGGVVEYGVTLGLTGNTAGIRPGQSVSVSVITGEATDTLYVPATAVTTSGTTAGSTGTVRLVSANGTESTVTVVVGIQGTADDQILSGLTAGEQVLTSTQSSAGSNGFPAGGGLFRGGGGGGLGGGLGGGGGGGGRGGAGG
jgi:macrolide-specific efflux system membrane fusion protein